MRSITQGNKEREREREKSCLISKKMNQYKSEGILLRENRRGKSYRRLEISRLEYHAN